MLWLINYNNCINSDGYYLSSLATICEGNDLYILDTDDLIVEKVDYKTLFDAVISECVNIHNVRIDSDKYNSHGNELYLSEEVFDFMDYFGDTIQLNDNLGIEENKQGSCNKSTSVSIIFPKHKFTVRAVVNDFVTNIFVDDNLVFRYIEDFHGSSLGIPYLFRLGKFIVVKVMIVTFNTTTYSFTVILDTDGTLLDCFPSKDDSNFNYKGFESKCPHIRSKYLTLLVDKY